MIAPLFLFLSSSPKLYQIGAEGTFDRGQSSRRREECNDSKRQDQAVDEGSVEMYHARPTPIVIYIPFHMIKSAPKGAPAENHGAQPPWCQAGRDEQHHAYSVQHRVEQELGGLVGNVSKDPQEC